MVSRNSNAQSAVELVAGLVILVPIILFIVDLSVIVLAGFKNDSVCREACRVAATCDPKDCRRLALTEINKSNQSGSFTVFSLDGDPKIENQNAPASGHGLFSGTVKVATKARVHAPFLIGFFTPTVDLNCEHSFPFTYTVMEKKEETKE